MLQQRFLLVACLVAYVSSCAICGEGGSITKPEAMFDLPPESQGKYPAPYETEVPCGIMEVAAKNSLINELECTQLTTLTNVYDICGCEGGVRATLEPTLEPTPAPTAKSPVTTEGDAASLPTDETLTDPVPTLTPVDALNEPTSSSSAIKYFISVLGMVIGVLFL